MKTLLFIIAPFVAIQLYAQNASLPIVNEPLIFEDKNGMVAVEAEHFYKQTKTDKRFWYINSPSVHPGVWPDYDTASCEDAGGLAYVEALPDLFHSEEDPIISGDNLGNSGNVAVMHYKIFFNKPGLYYIWTRLRSNDQEDNTTQAGINDTWPITAQILQSPVEKKTWIWKSENRLSRKPWKIGRACLEVPTAGLHDIQFAMREDGCQIDRMLLTSNSDFVPSDSVAIPSKIKKGNIKTWYETRDDRMSTVHKFVAEDGLLTIEPESIPSTKGWKYFADTSKMSGFGFLEWTEEGQGIKPGKGILSYTFEISEPGNYQFLLRSKMKDPKNRMETPDADGNDIWVKFTGGKDIASQKQLGNDWFKVAILGHPEGWNWNTNADGGAPHPLTPVCRYFDKGVYTVELSGRSKGHIIDKMVLTQFKKSPITDFDKHNFSNFTGAKESRRVKQ